jgi:Mannosyltransferase putative
MVRSCSEASPSMTAERMAELIADAPPGPWPEGWAGWDCTRDAIILMMEEVIKSLPPYDGSHFQGRGIVSSVSAKPGYSSGKNLPQGYFPGAWVMVRELRRLGCTLPITFTHCGPLEWDARLTQLVKPLGVDVIDLQAMSSTRSTRILAGWESKVYGTLWSPYEEVLYLDADNLPLIDPTYLFDSSQYKYCGSIFWADVPPYDRREWLPECVWRNIGLMYRDEVDFESGQYLINKRKCWRELLLTQWINEYSDYFYKFVFGDKSTFHLAWAKLSSNWAISSFGPGGNQASLIQHDFTGQQIFQHCTRNKPSLAGYPSPGSLLNHAQCMLHLADLGNRWDGRMWDNDTPSSEEKAWAKRLIGQRYTYIRAGLDSREIRLLADHRIGRGLAVCEVSWSLYIDDRGPLIAVTSIDGVLTFIVRPAGVNSWSGRWVQYERCEVMLAAEGDTELEYNG